MLSGSARSTRIVAAVAATLLVLLVGIWLGGHASWLPSPLRAASLDDASARLTHDVLGRLERDYYRPLDTRRLLNQGLTAAVTSLDPYSNYFDPVAYRAFENQSDPHLSGIGVDVAQDPRGLRLVEVFAGSPAARAGLLSGDLIVGVGTTSLAHRPASFASGLVKGRAGTPVTLTVLSGGRQRKVSLTRASIVIPVASGRVVTYHGLRIGDLQLTAFTAGSGAQLRSEVDKALHASARALILDMRGNGGGRVDEAVNVASIFIPDGTIVSTAGRSQPRRVYVANGGAIPTSIPLVVLVDKGSASAAEIVTAALQDRHRATVVGTPTYGKGVFQEIETLSNGGALDITVGEYFTPSGRNLGGGGVKRGAGVRPDVSAADNPHTRVDEALAVAERTVAGQSR